MFTYLAKPKLHVQTTMSYLFVLLSVYFIHYSCNLYYFSFVMVYNYVIVRFQLGDQHYMRLNTNYTEMCASFCMQKKEWKNSTRIICQNLIIIFPSPFCLNFPWWICKVSGDTSQAQMSFRLLELCLTGFRKMLIEPNQAKSSSSLVIFS